MKWHVFKNDDPSTWPQINCPMIVVREYSPINIHILICEWDDKLNKFIENKDHYYNFQECFYSYVGYIPSGYKTHHLIRCLNDNNCKIGCADDGYCMYDFCKCEQQSTVNEYEIETKRIWRDF